MSGHTGGVPMNSVQTAPQSATLLHFPSQSRPKANAFTFSDRAALQSWNRRAALSGYGRLVIEPGCPGAGPDCAPYAAIYIRDDPWSRWGLTRGENGITVWCSRTGADCGTFDSMDLALATLK